MTDVKLTMSPALTPSQQILAKAAESFTITDSKGRGIVLKKPGVLAQFRLVEALGDTASNQVYMRMVLPLIYVTEIDGQHATAPTKKIEIEALIQRLDEHGIAAVMDGVSQHFGESDPEADKTAIKK